ncbi:MAG TPA: Asp-tRNA(Asn)/Glu-tRNA(Gln) amidotransferase subunit GatC [Gemmatimonadaceae bacterium]|nr:Asp-tRNA(Asn)/Glu-tRNA(Gln) amidotransferase subunit GatC [Gemmatimonadaceae bacterium]
MAGGVSIDDVRHVAALARLALTDECAAALVHDLNAILSHMAALEAVDTSTADESAEGEGQRLREDRGGSVPLDLPLSGFAPEFREGFFVVPRLANHEDTERDA